MVLVVRYMIHFVPMLIGMLLLRITTFVQCQLNDPCNFCRSPNVVNKPNQNIDSDLLALLGISQPKFTCQDLYLIGIEGWFNDNTCLFLQSVRRLRINCQCAPVIVKPPTTTMPTVAPVQPTIQPITISPNNKGGMDKVMDKKPKQQPQAKPITTAPVPVVIPTTQAPVPVVIPTTQVPVPVVKPTTQAPVPVVIPTTQVPVPVPTTTSAPAPDDVVATKPTTQVPIPVPVPTITLTIAPSPTDGVATKPTTQVPVPVPVPIVQPILQQGGGMVMKTKTNAPQVVSTASTRTNTPTIQGQGMAMMK